jgi:hypothetical protein
MSYINSYVKCLFGRTLVAEQAARAMSGSNAQTQGENITATVARETKGPQRGAHMSYHGIIGAGSAPSASLSVWYSNLPDPDVTNDNHWVLDASIAAQSLNAAGSFFGNLGNVNAEHVRFKVTYTSGTANLVLWVRAEGVEV